MTDFQSVIERLRVAESAFPAFFGGGSGDSRYTLHCHELAEESEFAIYKRKGANFIIVDFFSKLEDANEEAIEILSNYPTWIMSINHHTELYKQDISGAKS